MVQSFITILILARFFRKINSFLSFYSYTLCIFSVLKFVSVRISTQFRDRPISKLRGKLPVGRGSRYSLNISNRIRYNDDD